MPKKMTVNSETIATFTTVLHSDNRLGTTKHGTPTFPFPELSLAAGYRFPNALPLCGTI